MTCPTCARDLDAASPSCPSCGPAQAPTDDDDDLDALVDEVRRPGGWAGHPTGLPPRERAAPDLSPAFPDLLPMLETWPPPARRRFPVAVVASLFVAVGIVAALVALLTRDPAPPLMGEAVAETPRTSRLAEAQHGGGIDMPPLAPPERADALDERLPPEPAPPEPDPPARAPTASVPAAEPDAPAPEARTPAPPVPAPAAPPAEPRRAAPRPEEPAPPAEPTGPLWDDYAAARAQAFSPQDSDAKTDAKAAFCAAAAKTLRYGRGVNVSSIQRDIRQIGGC